MTMTGPVATKSPYPFTVNGVAMHFPAFTYVKAVRTTPPAVRSAVWTLYDTRLTGTSRQRMITVEERHLPTGMRSERAIAGYLYHKCQMEFS